jgi:hypothetical protein
VEATSRCSHNTHIVSVYSLRHLHQGRNELLQFANRSSRPLRAKLPLLSNFPIPPSKTCPIPLVFFMVCSSYYFYFVRFCDYTPLNHSSRYGNVHSQSQSHIATDGQSVCLSWCRAPSRAHDQIFILPWKLLSSPDGAPSLTRGRVCHLSVIVTGFSQLSVVNIFIILQILTNRIYNIYKGSVSSGSVQQTMPYF